MAGIEYQNFDIINDADGSFSSLMVCKSQMWDIRMLLMHCINHFDLSNGDLIIRMNVQEFVPLQGKFVETWEICTHFASIFWLVVL